MIVITNIETAETDREVFEYMQLSPMDHVPVVVNGEPSALPVTTVVEYLEGRRFVRPDGSEITIALSAQAQDIIGLQYKAWHNMVNELTECRHANIYHRNKMTAANSRLELETSTFWKRLKHLFMTPKP